MEQVKFTEVEQRVYNEVVKCVKQRTKGTVAQIAKEAQVAPSTIIKLAKKLGYPGWTEMYYSLCSQTTD